MKANLTFDTFVPSKEATSFFPSRIKESQSDTLILREKKQKKKT